MGTLTPLDPLTGTRKGGHNLPCSKMEGVWRPPGGSRHAEGVPRNSHSPVVQFQPLCQLTLQVTASWQSSHHCSQSSWHSGTSRIRSFRQLVSACRTPSFPSSPRGSWLVGEGGICTYLVNPWPQVGGALIQTRVLDEVALALLWHGPAVVPVEVVQVGLVLVGFHTGVGSAAGIVLPEGTLHQGSRGSVGTHQDPPGLSWDMLWVRGKHQCPWVGDTG